MRKYFNQYVFSPLFWIMSLLLLTLFLMVILLFVPVGPKILALVATNTIDDLSIEGVSGSILTGLHVDKLWWDFDVGVILKDININVDQYDLKNRKLLAERATVGELSIVIKEGRTYQSSASESVLLPNFGLPINIDADQLQLDSLKIVREVPDGDNVETLLFHIEDMVLKRASIKDGQLTFGKLQGSPIIWGEALEVNATNGSLNMNQPHEISTRGDVSFVHPVLGDLQGKVQIGGTLTEYTFDSKSDFEKNFGQGFGQDSEQDKVSSGSLVLNGNGNYKRVDLNVIDVVSSHGSALATGYVLWDSEVRLFFDIEGKQLKTNDFFPNLPVVANTNIKYNGSFIDSRLKNNIDIVSLEGDFRDQKFWGQGQITEREGLIRAENLILQLGDNRLTATGTITEPLNLDLAVDAQVLTQILPTLTGEIQGSASIKGEYKAAHILSKLSANNLSYGNIKQGEETLLVEGEVTLHEEQIQLKSLLATSGKNSIAVSGKVSEPVDLNIEINTQQLSEVSPDITGGVTGTATLRGAYKSLTLVTDMLVSALSFKGSRLTNTNLKLHSEVEISDGNPLVKKLNTQMGNNTIQISGKANSPFDLSWNIDSKNLKQVIPDLSGSLFVKGKLQGTIDKPIINAVGNTKNLKYENFSLQSGDFSANTNDGIYQIKGNLTELKNLDKNIRSVKLALNGRIENHTMVAVVDHPDATINLNVNGGWQKRRWAGVVKTLKFTETSAGDWKLQSPTKVSLSQSGFSTAKLCLNRKNAQACSTTSYNKVSGLIAKGSVQGVPLSLLKPFLPEAITLQGDIDGSYDIKQNDGKPRGMLRLKLPQSSFSVKGEDGEEQSFIYDNAEIKASIDDRIVTTQANMKIINRGVFLSTATIKLSPKDGRHTIDGKMDFDVPNINFAQRFIPRSRGLRGALKSQLTFSGLLNKPQIQGQATIKNGYLRLPEAGTEITNINLKLRADKPGQALIKGKMSMGKGVLNISGDMNLKDVAKWKANVKISGENIRFMNTNEIKATMSPDITLKLTPQLVSIIGEIKIPEADIRLEALPETSIDESTDTFVIGESKLGEKVTFVKIRPKVMVRLGEKVRMDAFGLEARLSGDVNITHNNGDILADGSLRVQEGEYQAYGQDLAIDNGRLIFNGSPRLVGMDIRAIRTIDKQIVGIHLGGTLLSPKSTLFADPALSEESEILSYLITGNTLSSASGQESALLLSAVRGLGVTGSGSIVQQIGSAFGLDDVNIVTKDDLKKSELALGKRLGSRLYVRYLIGLFDQTQKIAIEYKINDALSLEAQTTPDDFGLDFIYEIERD